MDGTIEALLDALIEVGGTLDAAIVVPHSPRQEAIRAAAYAPPRAGDLVLVQHVRHSTPARPRVGRYLAREEEETEDGEGCGWAHVIVTAAGEVISG